MSMTIVLLGVVTGVARAAEEALPAHQAGPGPLTVFDNCPVRYCMRC